MYNLRIIKCGKRIEIYKINGYVVNTKGEKVDKNPQTEKPLMDGNVENIYKDKQSSKDRKTTLNNARNSIVRLIKCNEDMNTFITLTFKKESNYKDSKALLNNCFNKLRRKHQGLKYLWVLEYGDKTERLHYHVLCNIPIKIKLSTTNEKKSQDHKELENDFKKKYWNHGWVFIRSLEQENNTNIALYVSVYITKSMQDKELEGYRIYGYSIKTLDKPIDDKIYTLESTHEIIERYSRDYDIKYSNSYGIGYTKDYKEYEGVVTYFDLNKKE